MTDPDRVWHSLVRHARLATAASLPAMPDGFAERVIARLPAARAAVEVRQRERWVFRAAAAAVVAAAVTVACQWPAFAGSHPWPVSVADIIELEPVP